MVKYFLSMLIAVCWCCGLAVADQPPAMPEKKKVYSQNRKFYASMDYKLDRTTVYRNLQPPDNPEMIWGMPGWFEVASLSNDGDTLVVGYPGNNLLDLNYRNHDVMLTIYRRGHEIAEFTLEDLIQDSGKLIPTASHYQWGTYLGFDEDGLYRVQTIEDRIVKFDVKKGVIIEAAHE